MLLSHHYKLGGFRFELDCIGVICLGIASSCLDSLLNMGGKKFRVKWHILVTSIGNIADLDHEYGFAARNE